METKKYFLILAVVTGLVVLFPSLPRQQSEVSGAFAENSTALPLAPDRSVSVPEARDQVTSLEIGAAAAWVKDLGSGTVLYDKHSRKPLPVASLTKLMTALVAEEHLAPDDTVRITTTDLQVPEGKAGFVAGEELLVQDLLAAMLVASANDAAMALARASSGSATDFVAAMNQKAASLGMTETAFRNPVGLDEAGHFSTARDLGLLTEEFLRHPALVQMSGRKSQIITDTSGKYSHDLITTNKLLEKDGVVGLKTGYTTEAKGNLILLVEKPLVYSIVLGSDNREEESERVLSWIRENFTWPSNTTSIGREAAQSLPGNAKN